MTRLDAPATARNRAPILAILARWLPAQATARSEAHAPSPAPGAGLRPELRVLEIASGTGQHAAYFAAELPHVFWQPSDVDDDHLASIAAWRAEAGRGNLAAPIRLDVRAEDWGVEPVDALFNANMIHIAPWSAAEGLLRGARRVLRGGGFLFLYGPFRVGGRHTAPSNEAFDADLRRRNPEWGVRDLERVVETARTGGLLLRETNDMPANNKLLVFEVGGAPPGH